MTKLEEKIFDAMKREWKYGSGWRIYAIFGQEPKWHKNKSPYYNFKDYWFGFRNALEMLHPISYNRVKKKFSEWEDEFISDRNREGFITD